MNAAVEDGQNLAAAYRAAADADSMDVMNVQSSGTGLDDLRYFVVPAVWYKQVWKTLLSPRVAAVIPADWREQIDSLPAMQTWFFDQENSNNNHVADQDNIVMKEIQTSTLPSSSSPWNQITPNGHNGHTTTPSLGNNSKSNKEHLKDYFLVGKHAWALLANKFGTSEVTAADATVECHVVSFPKQDSKLAVNIPPDGTQRISIPASGRFPYETILEATEDHNETMSDWVAVNKVEDEDEAMNGGDDANVQEAPILTLPPSTTTPPQSPHRRHSTGASSHTIPTLREYGSGLANLGNTCFMSSTIQCLGHATPLLKYFLSGSFLDDLNRDNPLGSGGEMALAFSKLLRDIWIENNAGSSRHLGYLPNNVVYPRPFKHTVGRHAEQFSGYDQHDSQEFVTYLLDILHEDTNRISKKPYVEKPEQGENETDEEASKKAWELSLERDSSHILDFFMGQLKSRLQCCEEDCGRISTTFEPFVYLSVPIPGTEDRQVKVWFIPLDPEKRPIKMTLVVPKTGSVADLLAKCRERVVGLGLDPSDLADEDLVAVDMFNEKVWQWFNHADPMDKITENDSVYIYQLRSLNEVRRLSTTPVQKEDSESGPDVGELASSGRTHQLDPISLRRLNNGASWEKEFSAYLTNPTAYLTCFNHKKGSIESRLKFLNQVKEFVSKCNETLLEGGYLKTDADEEEEHNSGKIRLTTEKNREEVPGLVELSDSSNVFQGVSSIFDVAVLEFCAGKLHKEILNTIVQKKKDRLPDGAVIEVRSSRHRSSVNYRGDVPGAPLVIRIPSNMTVYELREELANRMRRSIRTGRDASSGMAGEATSENHTSSSGMPPPRFQDRGTEHSFGSPELLVLRQIPMSVSKAGQETRGIQKSLGAVEKATAYAETEWGKHSSKLAKSSDDEEKEEVAGTVGDHGSVFLDWPKDLAEESFDVAEYNTVEEAADDAGFLDAQKPKETTTVIDCIDKYCQKEQLEETEMWYCNRCKKHVRAWKQFHLYRSPPILIIHLKRFQFSATTHRRDKISRFIDFPLEGLDLTEHFLSWKEDEKPIYDCFGVSNHYGGLGGGHYTAHALHSNGVWCYYDDTRITTNVDPNEVVTNAAYVLYYRRRDVSVDMDFPIAVETPERRTPPAVILENADRMNGQNDSASDSNAAMVGDDDNMEVEDVETASHSTAPMIESVGWEDAPSPRPLFGEEANDDDTAEAPRQ